MRECDRYQWGSSMVVGDRKPNLQMRYLHGKFHKGGQKGYWRKRSKNGHCKREAGDNLSRSASLGETTLVFCDWRGKLSLPLWLSSKLLAPAWSPAVFLLKQCLFAETVSFCISAINWKDVHAGTLATSHYFISCLIALHKVMYLNSHGHWIYTHSCTAGLKDHFQLFRCLFRELLVLICSEGDYVHHS